jgi:4-oxalomesaconate hydratase
MCEFKPQVLLDITEVFHLKRQAMECMVAQEHLWEYYTDVAKRRGTQAVRNSGNKAIKYAEAYQRVYPQVTGELS